MKNQNLIELRKATNSPDAVFIWIPRTAGTSIWTILDAPKLKNLRLVKDRFTNRGVVTFGHMDYSQLVSKGFIKSRFDNSAFKFCFVRNPYDRAVSSYSSLQKIGEIPVDDTFLAFCRRIESTECSPIGLYNYLNLSTCNPQVRWIENTNIDYIGKVESIEKDIYTICQKLRINGNHVSTKNKSNHSPYQDYYCRESQEIIQEFYREDFREFGYSRELITDLT